MGRTRSFLRIRNILRVCSGRQVALRRLGRNFQELSIYIYRTFHKKHI